MSKYVIYEVSSNTPDQICQDLAKGGDRLWNTLGIHLDYSDAEYPTPGDRPINEYLKDEAGRKTHSRFTPWVVESVEAYVPDLPIGQRFDEVVICTCAYSPLPEAENPWVPINRLQPTVESFGGDADAFEAWRSDQNAEQAVGV